MEKKGGAPIIAHRSFRGLFMIRAIAMSLSTLCLVVNVAAFPRRVAVGHVNRLLGECSQKAFSSGSAALLRTPRSFTLPKRFPAFLQHNQVKLSMSIKGGNTVDCSPDDVLSFWFGAEINGNQAEMELPEYTERMGKRWFFSSADFDTEVRDTFAEVIRAVAGGMAGPEWEGEKGRLAKIILFDQLSRNAFRGTPEAFQYDEAAVQLARSALSEDMYSLPICVVQFTLMPLMHSESLQDQEALLAKLKERAAVGGAAQEMTFLLQFAEDHRVVVARFGHFPHRNSMFGRQTTAEEAAWLASPDCPAWAKSQSAA